MKPAVVVAAYNRPESLRRLLASLQAADYPPGVDLVISIDGGGDHSRAVHEVAASFAWPAGNRQVIPHDRRLGLIDHLFACGDLTQSAGSIILLEDDLIVSRAFYRYAAQALDFYRDDPAVAGISLNRLWFNGYTHRPFEPYPDDGDVFFLQAAWFQGQAYTREQWAAFRSWEKTADRQVRPEDGLHPSFARFPPTDWFPLKTKYLAQTGRCYVLPRESLTVNFGESGTHFARPTPFFQVPLQHFRREFRFLPLSRAIAVYDAYQEMLPDRLNRLTDRLAAFDYTVDLNGTRPPAGLRAPYALTIRPCRRPLQAFGLVMRPREANVVWGVPGLDISLARTDDLMTGRRAEWVIAWRQRDYGREERPGRRERLRQLAGRWLTRWFRP